MKRTMKMENRIMGAAVFACYLLALTACGLAAHALVTLSRTTHGGLGRGFFLTTSQF